MKRIAPGACFLRSLLPTVALASCTFAGAQQTLGNLAGTVTDRTGALVPGVQIQLKGDQNGVTLTSVSSKSGTYQFQNLPVGTYTLVFTLRGFETERVPDVQVQENRTGSINVSLNNGSENTTVTVNERPLLNETDATNGYVLDSNQIQTIPLATQSYTQAAILAPGVSSELLGGIGTNAGLGNSPIWANGQRDTSNGFAVNGVDVTNLFNGKSSSEDNSQRYAFNIGQGASVAGQSQTNTSVYGSNGNGLATPPPEFIQELRVNTSEYDAQQGNRSGAQIDVSTSTGTNEFHGQVYGNRATNFANAAPYFNKQGVLVQQNLPYSFLVPQLHRDYLGGTVGGPILKNKLFFFVGYENLHDADALKGYSAVEVPFGLSDDRSQAGILNAINSYNTLSSYTPPATSANPNPKPVGATTTFNGTFDPVAMALLNAKLPNGQYLIPSATNTSSTSTATNAFINGNSVFKADEATAALDYNASSKDRVALKYYYQHAPDLSPFTNANTAGYPATEDTGAQVGSISNSITLGSKINWEQRLGFSRQKVYSTFNTLPGNPTFGIGFPGGTGTPGITLSKFAYSNGSSVTVGPNSNFANAGYFQNRLVPSTNLILSLGKHNLSIGSNYSYTQLNVRNRRTGLGSVTAANFVTFVEGQASASSELLGPANRYYRSNEVGSYVQDQWRATPNLSITMGIRYDYDGGFTEKYGNIFNFEPTLYNVTQSVVNNSGFVVAGNNAFDPTAGVSNSTLTGRQWGISPRLGFAYTPPNTGNKLVVRGSFGTYYDRGEYFSYLSQPAGSSTGGPFGATEAPPLVNYVTGTGTRTLENPLGSAPIPTSSANPASFTNKLITANQIRSGCGGLTVEMTSSNSDCAVQPFNFGAYARNNKLPYTINYALNVQFQMTKSMVGTLGYTGNLGRHLVIPVPFNQPGIATPTNPINGETSSYGYEVLNTASLTGKYYNPISTEPYDSYDGGNIDLRVPYVGYSPNAALFEAAGISDYNALEAHVEKRLTNYTSFTVAYTFSHALDEQSDVGLFFTGDNPNNLHDSYAKADFDRTHILNLAYVFQLPKLVSDSRLLGKFTNGWQLAGIARLQSGQPFSLYEYDGAVGSIYFGNYPTLANPVIGIKDGAHPKSALTGHPGTQLTNVVTSTPTSGTTQSVSYSYVPYIDPSQLQINRLAPGQKGIPLPVGNEPADVFENDFTPGQRNIFRQGSQKDADISLQKVTRFNDRFSARYTFDVYNVTNTFSPDVPNNSATISASKLTAATAGTAVAYGQVATSGTPSGQEQTDYNRLYTTPPATNSFGAVRNAIGEPRTVEMSLHLLF
jgi:hypothetical protein